VERDRVTESRLVETEGGLKPDGGGWFVVNVADAAAGTSEKAGYAFVFENAEFEFPHFGINIHVLQPGQPASLYHREEAQEAFLVLQGEAVLVVENEERRLRQWDFFNAAPGTAHVLVGGGDGPCAILMVGARRVPEEIVYPVSEAAARFGASAVRETDSAPDAYGEAGWARPQPGKPPWPPR
jgi:uncharacterized cupin superfamily protein